MSLLVEACFGFSSVKAQPISLEYPTWVRIGASGVPGNLNAIYFSDTLHGVVAFAVANDDSELYYTLNARRWFLSSVPSALGKVRAIRPIAGKLYATVAGQDLIVSTDQGVTWKYSGLGLTDAYDVYADPSGTIRTLTNPMRQFARVDQLHCVAAGLKNAALISNDGGVTWKTISIGDDSASYHVYGDTCKHVFLYHSNQGEILRSSDYGITWKNPLIGCGDYPEVIEGSDEVVYVSTTEGLYRTIDDGYTSWTYIASVGSGPPVFCAFGPMGNDLATEGFPPASLYVYIELSKDGADYTLRDPLALADSLGNIVDTLEISLLCPGLRIPIPFENGIDSINTLMTFTQDSLSEFTLEGPSTFHSKANIPDTVWFYYSPHSMPEISTLNLDFQHTWDCSIWDEARTIIVTTNSIAQITMPSVISGNCSIVNVNGTMTYGAPCQALIITSVSSGLPYLKSTANFPDTISGAQSTPYQLPFKFDPGDSTVNETDTVEIKGYYLGTSTGFDTILTVQLVGSATAPQLSSLNRIDFGTLNTCIGIHDTFVIYSNHGCVTDTITSMSVSGAGFVWLPDSLPIILPPGDSLEFRYRFAPDTTAYYTGIATAYVVSSGDTEKASLDLSGSGFQNLGLPSITSPMVDCGSVSSCTGDTILTDTLSNPGCDTIVISQMAFYNDSTFTLIAPANDTLVLAPGESGILKFEFAPRSQGVHSGVLNLNSAIKDNFASNDIGIVVSGIGLAGAKLLTANVQNVNIGTFYACQEGAKRDTSIILYNTGCDSVTLDHPYYSNYQYKSKTHYPFELGPGDSAIVNVQFTLDTFSSLGLNGSIGFLSDADTGGTALPSATISFTGSILPPVKLRLSLSSPDSGKDGQFVTFYLILSGSGSANNLPAIHFDLIHNDDLLTFLRSTGPGLTEKASAGTAPLHFTYTSGGSSNLPDTIGSLTFLVSLTDSSATPLKLSNISLGDTLGNAGDCIASLDDSSGSGFTYIFQCGDHIVQDAMNGLPFAIRSIQPNPAQSSIHVLLSKAVLSAVTAELYDLLGTQVLSQTESGTDFTLDLGTIPEGSYYLRISQESETETRRIEVIK